MSVDLARVNILLNVVDVANQWPALKGLHDRAMGELVDMNAEALVEIAEVNAKKAAAAAAAEVKLKAEADAKKAVEEKVTQQPSAIDAERRV